MYLKKERTILALPQRYLIFLDEVGVPSFHRDINIYKNPSVYPILTITALIISRKIYGGILMKDIDDIKQDLFGSKNICFHSREIRRKDGIFKIFINDEKYLLFKKRMDDAFEKSSIVIISSSIDKLKLLKKAQIYEKTTGQRYDFGDLYLKCVGFVIERVGHFLSSDDGKVIFESRGKKESKRIQAILSDAKKSGTFYCPRNRFKNIDEEILFFDKKDNINGLQAVDYCAYPFSRHAKNSSDTNNKFFDFLRQFIYKGDYREYGLKEWP
jgi:hypothetical protein